MAIPHLNVSIITRSQGQSPVAAASYRSGEALYNEQEKKLHDYTRKQDVCHKEILAPEHAPPWVFDRARLWNEVQNAEKRKDARFARSLTIALPRELSMEQNTVLIASFARENFVSHGMIADLAIHNASASDGGKNPHAHIMLTLRDVSADGFGKKNRNWDSVKCLESWRNAWERCVNQSMEQAGVDERISMKSYADQGIDKIPTKHMGPDAWQLEQQGVETHVGDDNRQICHQNALREILKAHWGEPEQAKEFAPTELVTKGPAIMGQAPMEQTPVEQVPEQEQLVSHQQPALARLETEASKPEGAVNLQLAQDEVRHKATLWEILTERWGTANAPDHAQTVETVDPLLKHRRSQHVAGIRLAAEADAHESGNESHQVDPDQAEHAAMLHDYLLTHDVITREQKVRMNIIRRYAGWFTDRAFELASIAARQFRNLKHEASRLLEAEHSYER